MPTVYDKIFEADILYESFGGTQKKLISVQKIEKSFDTVCFNFNISGTNYHFLKSISKLNVYPSQIYFHLLKQSEFLASEYQPPAEVDRWSLWF